MVAQVNAQVQDKLLPTYEPFGTFAIYETPTFTVTSSAHLVKVYFVQMNGSVAGSMDVDWVEVTK